MTDQFTKVIEAAAEEMNLLNEMDKEQEVETAKTRLIDSINTEIAKFENESGMIDQEIVISLKETLEEVNTLNLVQCHKLEKEITKSNDSFKKHCKKYGFNYEPVNPIDYRGILRFM
ncbi:MAG: hypothetical protein R3279_06445 [Putridiphycobacter sp.]|nr:hypothetical protein [Putridiphycobacter sp.]